MPRFAIRWDSLAMSMQGTLMLPGAPHFETARRVWNAMIDRRPAAIAACATRDDVVTAVRFAAESGIKVTVRGGGHSVGGLAIREDTLLIDLGGIRRVEVDARHRRATVGGGASWRDFDAAAGAFGLATTGGMVSTTGIGGLTLGGGIGWLVRKHGLASDNLLAAEVVLANGESVRASDDQHAELFFALRGGGARLGVVTEFAFKLHPVSAVLAGGLWCKAERASEVLRAFREFSVDVPDELTMMATATVAPPDPSVPPALHGKPVVVISCCWCGDARAGEGALGPLRARLRADADLIATLPYPVWQGTMDATAPFGMRNYWRSTCLPALDDAAIDWIAERCFDLPSPMSTISIHHLQGSVSRRTGDAADDLRPYPFVVNVRATWPSARHDAATIEWVRGCSNGVAAGHPRRAYVNFSDGDADGAGAELAFAPDVLARLRRAKHLYDPEAIFV
jgi:FAD/FMN-containing dehydrogenase